MISRRGLLTLPVLVLVPAGTPLERWQIGGADRSVEFYAQAFGRRVRGCPQRMVLVLTDPHAEDPWKIIRTSCPSGGLDQAVRLVTSYMKVNGLIP